MSTVSITNIHEGDPATIAEPNDTLQSWNSATVAIDEDNIREEGVSRRIINYGAVSPPYGRNRISTSSPLKQGFGGSTSITQMSSTANDPLRWTISAVDYCGITITYASKPIEVNFTGYIELNNDEEPENIFAAVKLIYSTGNLSSPPTGWSDFGGTGHNPTQRMWGYSAQSSKCLTTSAGTGQATLLAMDDMPLVQPITISHYITDSISNGLLHIGVYAYLRCINSKTVTTETLKIRRAHLEAHTWAS